MTQKHYLIVGGTGFIGQRLSRYLLRQAHEVTILGRYVDSFQVEDNLDSSLLHRCQADLNSFSWSSLEGSFDQVIYLAQSDSFRSFPERARDIFQINVSSVFNCLEYVTDKQIPHMLYVSTGGLWNDLQADSLGHVFSVPLGFYRGTKACAEILMSAFASSLKQLTIVRPFFVFGEDQRQDMLIPRLIDKISKNQTVVLHSESGPRINPIYIDAAIQALYNSSLRSEPGLKSFDICGKEKVTIRELCLCIGQIMNKEPRFEIYEGPTRDLLGNSADLDQLNVKQLSLYDEIAKTVHHYYGEC